MKHTRNTELGHTKYCSYLLIYINDILCMHNIPDSMLQQLNEYPLLKLVSIRESDIT